MPRDNLGLDRVKNPGDYELLLEGARQAGLPEWRSCHFRIWH
jgi:hypothetical protein